MAKPTINDVARLAGVSKKTVSRVINDSPLLNQATRAKVEQVIAEIGYVPDPQARALARRRNPSSAEAAGTVEHPSSEASAATAQRALLALIYDGNAAASLADAQGGALAAIRGSGFALTVAALDSASEGLCDEFRAFLEEQRPAGVVLLAPLAEIRSLGRICEELGSPHIAVGASPQEGDGAAIVCDDRAAADQATAYLISLGHERVGMVTGPEDSRVAQERELGYLDAMADHDLDRGPALIATGDHSFQSGYSAGHLLLEVSPRPTAIFAGNDEMAAGVVHAAAERGIKIPDGLSVMGFEDTPIAARLSPQLSTVRVPLAEMVRTAAQRLVSPDASEAFPKRFSAELVARGSTTSVSA